MSRPTLIIGAIVFAACNAYDPSLGDQPFRCGEGEGDSRCPDGYECVVYGPDMELCERASGGDGDGGGGGNCDNDELEPNDAIASASDTRIPDQQLSISLVGLSICPFEDVDLFRFVVEQSGQNLDTRIDFSSSAPLKLEVLNSGGTTIRTGTPDTDGAAAMVPNMPPGTYFVQVSADAGADNNYNIDITLSGP